MTSTLDIPIIFEDDSLLVINKPAGVVVNRADTTTGIITVQDWAEERIKKTGFDAESEIGKEFLSRSGVVHRLDKDTSGVLLVAKTPEVFEALKRQFQERETLKEYIALVHGKVTPDEGEIEAPIDRSPFNPRHFGVFPGGRQATTKYKVKERLTFDKEDLTLLEVLPKTGRTHQIRVHLKYINHPVVADPIYGGRKNGQKDQKWCPRLFLHARRLAIKHRVTGMATSFEAPLPKDLDDALKLLR